ncbi:helix-turn-helix domain-containing protein [Clostridium sediminicola]|uniref:helix-turn-helix domain-containing protein n=1 Tax=Clostridium sediminicola TaxID=3114879 RepID=UPI0031F25816
MHLIDNKEFKAKVGQVYVINKNCSHGFKNVENLEMYSVFYNDKQLMQSAGNIKEISGFKDLFVVESFHKSQFSDKNKMILDYSSQMFVNSIIDKMIVEYNEKKHGFDMIFHSYFMILVTFLSRLYMSCVNDSYDKKDKLAQAVEFLESNYTKKINVDELAQKACLSTRQFTRIFKENYKTTPMNHILQLRIKYACYLLANTNKSITEIAADCGFVDSNYFSKQFKKNMNISPINYKKENES